MSSRVSQLLSDLCIRFGLCLSPDTHDHLARDPTVQAKTFVDAVFRAEGLDPEQVDSHLRRQVQEYVDRELRFPCPCCGYAVHSEPPGSYNICEICFWEDDALQLEFATTLAGGANKSTLLEAQLNYAQFGACDRAAVQHVRLPSSSDQRDRDWRPIDVAQESFPDWNASEPRRAAAHDMRLYYWRADFWYAARAAV